MLNIYGLEGFLTHKVLVSQSQALLQLDLGLPAQLVQAGAVHPFAGGAVGFGGVKADLAGVAHGGGHGLGYFCNGDVAAIADVDVAAHGAGVGLIGGGVKVHDKDAGGGHVVYIQKLAFGCACAPDGHLGCAAGLCLMKAANECGDDVAVVGVVVVARAVEVGGHDAAVVSAVLAVVRLAEFDAGYFGHGIGFVGGFQGAGEQGRFGHGLGGKAGVDAAGAQEQELLHAVLVCGLNEVGLHHEVLVDEVCRVGVVGIDATYFGRGQIHLSGALSSKKGLDGGLVAEV